MESGRIKAEKEMMQFILGKWISKPVHTAVRLGIPDILAGGEKGIDDLAKIAETLPDPLYRMMRALAGVGIFAEKGEKVFLNTPLSESLMEGRLKAAALMFHSSWHDRMWDNLLYTLKTGNPAFIKVHGAPAFEWFESHPEEAKAFHEANARKAASSHGVMTTVYDFGDMDAVTDVGGGFGGLLIQILKANPHIKGVLADLPETVEHLGKIIRENGLEGRMSAVGCDFFEKIPEGSDAYLLSHILHDWPDDACIRILRNCRKAIGSKGKLLLAETVLPPGNTFSVAKLLDLEVLLMGGGRERSREEFEQLLKKSAFRLSRIIETEVDIAIIEGIPV